MNDTLERRHDPDTLNDINTRLTLIEADLSRGARTMLWLRGIAVVVVIQVIAVAVAYGRITQQMENLNLTELQQNVATSLTVLADHGTEIQEVRNEQARVRGNIDQVHEYMENLRRKVDSQTNDRFYKHDGDRLRERIKRLEDKILK